MFLDQVQGSPGAQAAERGTDEICAANKAFGGQVHTAEARNILTLWDQEYIRESRRAIPH